MKTFRLALIIIFFACQFTLAQDKMNTLPYYEIPETSGNYTAATVMARMIDGLGFRYYWATEGLRDKDLMFKPNDEARTTAETIDHIYGLSQVILNSALKKPNTKGKGLALNFEEKRKKTLEHFIQAATLFRETKDVSQHTIVFGEKEFPLWNLINGPIADAIWHCGQIVSFRRSSGNPFNNKVSLLRGKVSE